VGYAVERRLSPGLCLGLPSVVRLCGLAEEITRDCKQVLKCDLHSGAHHNSRATSHAARSCGSSRRSKEPTVVSNLLVGRVEQCAHRRRHMVPDASPAATAPGFSASPLPAPLQKRVTPGSTRPPRPLRVLSAATLSDLRGWSRTRPVVGGPSSNLNSRPNSSSHESRFTNNDTRLPSPSTRSNQTSMDLCSVRYVPGRSVPYHPPTPPSLFGQNLDSTRVTRAESGTKCHKFIILNDLDIKTLKTWNLWPSRTGFAARPQAVDAGQIGMTCFKRSGSAEKARKALMIASD
jgi:hypothetical protein